MRDATLERIHQIDIMDIIDRLGIEYSRTFGRVDIHCPLPKHKVDLHLGSCKVYPENNSFFCYACRERGDAVDITMKALGLNMRDAKNWLCSQYGIKQDSKNKPADTPIFVVDRKACDALDILYADDVWGVYSGPYMDEDEALTVIHMLHAKQPTLRVRATQHGEQWVIEKFLGRVSLVDFEAFPESFDTLVFNHAEKKYFQALETGEIIRKVVGEPSFNPAMYSAADKILQDVLDAVKKLVSDSSKFDAWVKSLPSKIARRALVDSIKQDIKIAAQKSRFARGAAE